jgi:hypothetical protein
MSPLYVKAMVVPSGEMVQLRNQRGVVWAFTDKAAAHSSDKKTFFICYIFYSELFL